MEKLADLKHALDESAIVAITDHRGKIVHVNANFCAISKYSAEELIGQDHRIVNSGYHSKEFIKGLWTKISQGQRFALQILLSKADIQTDFVAAPRVHFPVKYLESALTNLISNSLKYQSPERSPVIRIASSRIGNKVHLSLSDNGLGIDLKLHQSNLFKIRKTFHKHKDAKGFGLFMTKTQVEAMGGRIWAESEPNKGSTFVIEIDASSVWKE